MSADTNAAIAKAHYAAFNSRNYDQGAALVADDAQLHNIPAGVTFRGPEGYKQFLGAWGSAFSDGEVVISHSLANESGVVTEFRGQGTHDGLLPSPTGQIPPTGRKLDLPFVEVLEIEQGKIQQIRLYYDSMTLAAQLGLLPEGAR